MSEGNERPKWHSDVCIEAAGEGHAWGWGKEGEEEGGGGGDLAGDAPIVATTVRFHRPGQRRSSNDSNRAPGWVNRCVLKAVSPDVQVFGFPKSEKGIGGETCEELKPFVHNIQPVFATRRRRRREQGGERGRHPMDYYAFDFRSRSKM